MRSPALASLATLVLAIAAPLTAYAADEECRRDETVTALRMPAPDVPGKEVLGRAALLCGDKWSAANMMEKAIGEGSTDVKRFNLATAYVATGRYAAAAAIYHDLATTGRRQNIALDRNYVSDSTRSRRVDLVRESARRAKVLDQLLIAQPSNAPAPFSATEAGVNAAAIVGQVTITDEQAIALDAEARGAP